MSDIPMLTVTEPGVFRFNVAAMTEHSDILKERNRMVVLSNGDYVVFRFAPAADVPARFRTLKKHQANLEFNALDLATRLALGGGRYVCHRRGNDLIIQRHRRLPL